MDLPRAHGCLPRKEEPERLGRRIVAHVVVALDGPVRVVPLARDERAGEFDAHVAIGPDLVPQADPGVRRRRSHQRPGELVAPFVDTEPEGLGDDALCALYLGGRRLAVADPAATVAEDPPSAASRARPP
jgi:hypothetical protein